jgi:Arc/MetJ family transcription regulator
MSLEAGSMRTNIALDDKLVEEAFAVTGLRTKKELVHLALTELVRARGKKDLLDLVGQIRFRKGFNHKSMREIRYGSR